MAEESNLKLKSVTSYVVFYVTKKNRFYFSDDSSPPETLSLNLVCIGMHFPIDIFLGNFAEIRNLGSLNKSLYAYNGLLYSLLRLWVAHDFA